MGGDSEALASQASLWVTFHRRSSFLPRIVSCWRLPFPSQLQVSISLFIFQTLLQPSSCPYFSWTSPASSSHSLGSLVFLWGAVREAPPAQPSLGQSCCPRCRLQSASLCGGAAAWWKSEIRPRSQEAAPSLWAHPGNVTLDKTLSLAKTQCLHLQEGNGASQPDPTESFILFHSLR